MQNGLNVKQTHLYAFTHTHIYDFYLRREDFIVFLANEMVHCQKNNHQNIEILWDAPQLNVNPNKYLISCKSLS